METKNVNLIDYFYIIFKWRRLIVTNFLLVSITALIISILMPKWYPSTAVIMPPQSEFGNLNLASMVSKLPISGLGLPLGSSEVQAFMAILKSRSIMETIINKHNLISVYKVKNIERALKALEDKVDITMGDEGQIILSVIDKVPERATAMANTYVNSLDSIYTQLQVQKARNNRVFIGDRLEQNNVLLKRSEEKLKGFQENYGVVDIPEQTKAAISNAAEIQSLVYATEIELRTKQQYLGQDHIDVENARIKLRELKRKLTELKFGDPKDGKKSLNGNNLFIPLDDVPNLGLEYVRLLRDVEVENAIFEVLIKLYEQAKIEEAKDTPSIQILDQPKVPIYKAKPKRAIIVVVAALFSLIISCLYVFIKEYMNNLVQSNSEIAQKIQWIKNQTSQDFKFIRNRKKLSDENGH